MPPESLVGRTLGGYHVLAVIGSGGMGDVYRAHDPMLGRAIALKVLREDVTADPDGRLRFEQEARAASSLNHPNIVTIHEIGREGALIFIAQELVEGQTLRSRLNAGPLPSHEALDIARQIAGALAAAHAAHVVHRDLKPENVMLRRDGYAKVLDFGLAKLATAVDPSSGGDADTLPVLHTRPGVVMGTVGYMSPEQARGLSVDARTDIFSLGVVLYEMIASRPPFTGATPSDTLAAILTHEPTPLALASPGTSAELERLVSKALRKNPEERYQGMKDLLVDLKSASAVAAPVVDPRRRPHTLRMAVAVALVLSAIAGAIYYVQSRPPLLTAKDVILLTDFVNSTGEEVFDGATLKQALAVQLQQTPFLGVFPMEAVRGTLAMMARSPDEHVTPAVAREICVREGLKALVVGTIARLGRQYVVTLEAIGAETGESLALTQAEAGGQEQVLAALGQAANELRRALGESLSTLQQYDTPIEQATTPSLEALKAYSAGIELLLRENGRAAIPFFVRATDLDNGFAAAYDNGAWAYASSGGDPRRILEFAEKAFRSRDRATEREKLSATATYHHFATGNWEEENRLYEVWARLYSNDWVPHSGFALNYLSTGRFEDAAAAAREIIRLSPSIAQGYRFLAPALVRLGRFDEARAAIRQAQARQLDNAFLRAAHVDIALAQRDAAALTDALGAVRTSDGERAAMIWEARVAAADGRWRDAEALYARTMPAAPAGTPSGSRLPAEAIRRAALLGACQHDSADTAAIYATSRIGHAGVAYTPAIATDGSLCGKVDDAEALAGELAKRFPDAMLNRTSTLPILHAALALRRNQPERALEILRGTEAGNAFWMHYLRGQALLRQRMGPQAAEQFRAILAHPEWEPASPFLPLAQLGLARAAAMAGDATGSRRAYDAFVERWRGADQDLPVLIAARREFERPGR